MKEKMAEKKKGRLWGKNNGRRDKGMWNGRTKDGEKVNKGGHKTRKKSHFLSPVPKQKTGASKPNHLEPVPLARQNPSPGAKCATVCPSIRC
jgi:hypothetical protein